LFLVWLLLALVLGATVRGHGHGLGLVSGTVTRSDRLVWSSGHAPGHGCDHGHGQAICLGVPHTLMF